VCAVNRMRDRFRARLVRLTWRLALDRQRANRRRLVREGLVDPAPSAPAVAAADMRARQLWEAIGALPKKLRLVVVLAGIRGHDIREVAALLRVPSHRTGDGRSRPRGGDASRRAVTRARADSTVFRCDPDNQARYHPPAAGVCHQPLLTSPWRNSERAAPFDCAQGGLSNVEGRGTEC